MERYLIAAGLFAVALALFLGPLLSPARAQGAGFTQCVNLATAAAGRMEILDKKVFAIPAGWTPVGGGVVWAGADPIGGVLLCK